jgi:hypothetical protein
MKTAAQIPADQRAAAEAERRARFAAALAKAGAK